MKTFEDYRQALLAQADADGLTAWELAELSQIGAEPWA